MIFLDTSFIIAYYNIRDQNHDKAKIIMEKILNGKKIFRIAPIHHHFEASGWPPYKVTMRFWVISVVTAILGMAIALIGR